MTKDEIKEKVLSLLASVAPEADMKGIRPDVNFRDQIDIDSMDYLNFVIALDDEFQAHIPETDYTKFTTLDACVKMLESRLAVQNNTSAGRERE
jgi:acyl carrier protein